MVEVRRAIHIRTGQHYAIDAIDAWLARHRIDVIAFDSVYAACAHLLTQYEDIPDLALVGADFLAEDEFPIVSYLRQTWPRVGVVVYGETPRTSVMDLLPRTQACRLEGALQRLVGESPHALLQRLSQEKPPTGESRAAPAAPAAPATPRADGAPRGAASGAPSSAMRPPHADQSAPATPTTPSAQPAAPPTPRDTTRDIQLPADEPPRSILTAEELAALLDGIDED